MKTLPLVVPLLACAIVVTAGCHRRKGVTPEPAPPVAEPPAAPANPVPTSPRPAASVESGPAPALVTTRESNDAAYVQEMTQTLNDFLADYIREKKRVPRDINEMVSLKIITSIPVLPGGKKWVINQQTGKISAQ